MPFSQFKIYTSSDVYGPGMVTGLTGSLIKVLDACLVDGYGTGSYYKAPAGWTKPLPNISSSVGQLPHLGCFKQPSGSRCTMFVNDAAPGAGLGKEARIVGWELLTALTASAGTVYTASNSVGAGYGQFPLPSQLLTYGFCAVRKSVTTDAVQRSWMIAADEHTMYMWIATGDSVNRYYHFAFGDMFSFLGSNDVFRCLIMGRSFENTADVNSYDRTANIAQGSGYHSSGYNAASTLNIAQQGCFLVKSSGGIGGSIGFTKKGDAMQASALSVIAYAGLYQGVIATPNPTDNSYYISPISIVEPSGIMIRGRLRGIYHPCHPYTAFSDGQMITAAGDFVGKTFMCIRTTPDDSGVWLLETSNTVETNS